MRKNLGVKTFIYPQPVLIIGTYDENGKPNAMNAAWGAMADFDKVFVVLASEHKTTANLLKNKAFTMACGDKAHVAACDYVGIVSGNKEPDKVKKAGFTAVKSDFVNAPVFEELPITLECELLEALPNDMFIGKIKNVCADEKYLDSKGNPDLSKFTPISFDPANNKYLAVSEVVGGAFSDGKKLA